MPRNGTPLSTQRTRWQLRLPVLLAAMAMAGCGEKTEAEQLAELREGFTYTRYQQMSGPGLPAAFEAHRKVAELRGEPVPPLTPDTLCTMRVLAAYGALSTDQQVLTIAESDLIDAAACDGFSLLAARSMRAVVYQRRGWTGLAQAESALAEAPLDAAGTEQLAQLAALHLVLIYSGITDQRWDRVVLHVEGLGALLGQPWLGDLGHACVDIHEGRHLDGLRRIKRLSENPHVPEPIRQEFVRYIDTVEAQVGDLDASASRLLLRATWMLLQQHGPETLGGAMRFAEEHAWRRPLQATDDWREAIKAWWRRWRGQDDAPDGAAATPATG